MIEQILRDVIRIIQFHPQDNLVIKLTTLINIVTTQTQHDSMHVFRLATRQPTIPTILDSVPGALHCIKAVLADEKLLQIWYLSPTHFQTRPTNQHAALSHIARVGNTKIYLCFTRDLPLYLL